MDYIIPVMGHGTVGKDFIVNAATGILKTKDLYDRGVNIKSHYYDSSELGKTFLQTIMNTQVDNNILRTGIRTKNEDYRNCLVGILHSLDLLNVRYSAIINFIRQAYSDFKTDNDFCNFKIDNGYDKNDHFFFINIREVSIVKKLNDYANSNLMKCIAFVVEDNEHDTDPNYIATEVDNQKYQESLIPDLESNGISYKRIQNDKNDNSLLMANIESIIDELIGGNVI